jgi:hypothetical protein
VLSAEDQASDKFCSNVMSAYSVHIAGDRAQSVFLTLVSLTLITDVICELGKDVGSVQVTVALLYLLTSICLLAVLTMQSYLARQVR